MGHHPVLLVICYGMIYAAANVWFEKSIWGIAAKKYLVEWRTDSFLNLLLCAATVFTFSCAAILALGLTLHELGI